MPKTPLSSPLAAPTGDRSPASAPHEMRFASARPQAAEKAGEAAQ